MKKTFIPLLVVASIALMIAGCCLGKEDKIHEPEQKYLLKYNMGDTLVYKADNGQIDSFKIGGQINHRHERYDCYYEVWKEYLYIFYYLRSYPDTSTLSIYMDYENDFGITLFQKMSIEKKLIDTIVNGKHYPQMWHFYMAQNYLNGNHEKIPAYLLYDLSYNTGIVQYRDTSGVMWTLQTEK